MTITAKYQSICPACSIRIESGEQIEWQPGAPARHRRCPQASTPAPEAEQIADGYYTLVHADGSHRTLRIRTAAGQPAAGKTVVSLLTGPDNERHYTAFAFLRGHTLIPWKRYADQIEWIALGRALIGGDLAAARIAYALQSGRCARCGRRLTVPASLFAGVGPDCAGRL